MLCFKKTLIAFPRKESYAWQVARLVQENYLHGTHHILVILDDTISFLLLPESAGCRKFSQNHFCSQVTTAATVVRSHSEKCTFQRKKKSKSIMVIHFVTTVITEFFKNKVPPDKYNQSYLWYFKLHQLYGGFESVRSQQRLLILNKWRAAIFLKLEGRNFYGTLSNKKIMWQGPEGSCRNTSLFFILQLWILLSVSQLSWN